MSNVTEVLRLLTSTRMKVAQIAAETGASRNTVKRYRSIIQMAGYTWDDIKVLSPDQFQSTFNRRPTDDTWVASIGEFMSRQPHGRRPRTQLWADYLSAHPEMAISYARFTHYLRQLNLVKAADQCQLTESNDSAI